MKYSRLWGGFAACVFTFVVSSSHAALVSRLGGQAVYDTDFDITWIGDANLAASNTFGTAGINANGSMTWDTANNWIGNMNAANYLGFNDWRLPITPQPDASCSNQTGDVPPQGFGTGCTGSEMGHLYNVEGVTAAAPGLFSNVQSSVYWSGLGFAPDPSNARGSSTSSIAASRMRTVGPVTTTPGLCAPAMSPRCRYPQRYGYSARGWWG